MEELDRLQSELAQLRATKQPGTEDARLQPPSANRQSTPVRASSEHRSAVIFAFRLVGTELPAILL